ncbi:MAG: carbohydrate ABC transporter permease [Proteobacteria bacterium]|nr:carbohydrate ABC transporter permease [Pseudomonadota bacterium]
MPIYIMVATALKTMPEIRGGSALAWPIAPSLDAWQKAWSSACTGLECAGIHGGFANSVKIVVPSVLLAVFFGAVNGYGLTYWRFRGANLGFAIMLFAIFIPYQVFVFPMISISAFFGQYGTLAGVIAVHVIFGMPITTLMFRNYFAGLPVEVFKAARVDGAGYWRIFFRILLPMSRPIIVVALIWQATASWNDYLLGIVFAGRDNLPMTAQLNLLVSAELGVHEYDVDMAATLQTALIPLLIYFLSGKWFARGIAAGAVKG